MSFLLLILAIIFCSLIFAADVLFSLGAISLTYMIFLLTVFWFSRKNSYLISSIVVSVILTIVGWLFQTRETITLINLGIIRAGLDYESLFRFVSISLICFVGSILYKQKIEHDKLQELNETLDLRILAKTSVSEIRAKVLERQIRALKSIRTENATDAISKLDNVIEQLKELTDLENDNA